MLALLLRLSAQTPTLLEIAGALLIGYGVWVLWGAVAYLWAGVACFGLSFTLESRRTAGGRG